MRSLLARPLNLHLVLKVTRSDYGRSILTVVSGRDKSHAVDCIVPLRTPPGGILRHT